jgi:hypothetical protein
VKTIQLNLIRAVGINPLALVAVMDFPNRMQPSLMAAIVPFVRRMPKRGSLKNPACLLENKQA